MGKTQGPIVVVGQPRSGSTITTRVLNEFDGVFLLNDFYALQVIDAENLWDRHDPAAATRIAEIVLERLTVRATQEEGKTLEQSIDLDAAGLAAATRIARQAWPEGTAWHQVLEAVLQTAAQAAGCSAWGWNTPQDHLHLSRIFTAWPQARVLFVLRKPAAVLRSYKNVSGPWHDARRYNPVTIGIAWRVAARNFLHWAARKPDQVMFLRYEDLVAHTAQATERLARFLGRPAPAIDLAAFGRNSSHDGGRASAAVSASEEWVAEKVIGHHLADLGFAPSPTASAASGLFELVRVMARSGLFIGGQMLTDRDRRKRAVNFLRS